MDAQTTTGESVLLDVGISDQLAQQYLEELIKTMPPESTQGGHYKLHPVVQSFKEAIEGSAELTMHFTQIFMETPEKFKTPNLVKGYHHMLQLFNHLLAKAPEYTENPFAVFPFVAVVFRAMVGTIGGYAAFLNPTVNYHIKNILNTRLKFLESSESCYVLTSDGWFSEKALEAMGGNFEADFVCDPSKPHYGYTSWDNFFTRQFRPNVRPVAYPDDNKVIVNPCEAAPFRVESNITKHDKFWIKGTPYNLKFMLANDPLADKFVGGTVYQGFLNYTNYHRWHSPVDGKVIKAFVEDGAYFSLPLIDSHVNLSSLLDSQGYFANVNTRAVIFIEADNPYIGLMCFLAVGIAEASSCEITANEGQKVQKGQEMGMFHYGGSTFCLVFQPGVELVFDFHGETPSVAADKYISVNSRIATVPEK